jgi:hypothetical protein
LYKKIPTTIPIEAAVIKWIRNPAIAAYEE